MSDIKVHEKVDVGIAPNRNAQWELVPVHFHDFESLNATNDDIKSPEFDCCGNRWRLSLYPGGDSAAKDGFVSLFLYNVSGECVQVDFSLPIKSSNGYIYRSTRLNIGANFGQTKTNFAKGYSDFIKRSVIISSLIEGALVVDVKMRRHDYIPPSVPFVAENPYTSMILKMFMDEKNC